MLPCPRFAAVACRQIIPISLTSLLQADGDALARSTAIHNRAVQLHDSVLGGFASSGRTDIDLVNLCAPAWLPACFPEQLS